MNAIVFAAYIPAPDRIWLGQMFLNSFKAYYSDCDIYVGNNSPCQEWLDVLNSSDLNINHVTADKNLELDSDASAYQAALNSLRESGKEYDIVWFVHTKSATRSVFMHLVLEIFDRFINRRDLVEESFSDPAIGAFLPYTAKVDERHISGPLDVILPKTENQHSGISSYYTFYAIRGSVIKHFVDKVLPDFWIKRITDWSYPLDGGDINNEEQSFDRYFFEREFPMVFERLGLSYDYLDECYRLPGDHGLRNIEYYIETSSEEEKKRLTSQPHEVRWGLLTYKNPKYF